MTDSRRSGSDDGVRSQAPLRSSWEHHGDAALIAGVAGGDRSAFAEVYERHGASAISLARNLCGDSDARSIVRDTFLTLWRLPEAFERSTGSLRSFVLLGVERRAFERMTSRGTCDVGPMSELRRNERRALAISVFGGEDRTDAAHALGLSPAEVRRLLLTGLRQARRALDDRPLRR